MGIVTTTGERILAALYWQTETDAGATLHEIAATLIEQQNVALAPGDRATLSLTMGGYEYATVEIVMTPRPKEPLSA